MRLHLILLLAMCFAQISLAQTKARYTNIDGKKTNAAIIMSDEKTYITMKVTPATASVTIDGNKYTPDSEGALVALLSRGEHRYVVEEDGYARQIQDFVLQDTRLDFTVNLVRNIRDVQIVIEPSSAKASIDNQALKLDREGSAFLSLKHGLYVLHLEAEGYRTEDKYIDVTDNTSYFDVTMTSVMASLTIHSEQPNVDVYIDGEPIKGKPSRVVPLVEKVIPGMHTIEIRHEGFRSQSKTITLEENEERTVTFPALVPCSGRINVAFTPVDAKVYIDGMLVGASPNVFEGIMIGEHEVDIRKRGYSRKTCYVYVKDNETETVEGALNIRPADVPCEVIRVSTTNEESSIKYGYEDEDGNVLIPIIYDDITTLYDDIAIARKDGKYGAVNIHGQKVVSCVYDNMKRAKDCFIVRRAGKFGIIDGDGRALLPCSFNQIYPSGRGEFMVVEHGKYGKVDEQGNETLPCMFSESEASLYHYGLQRIENKGKYGFRNYKGKKVVSCKYDNAKDFYKSVAIVEKKQKWGLINLKGRTVIPLEYEKLELEENGIIKCRKYGKYGFLNIEGEEVAPCHYDYTGNWVNGVTEVQKDGLYGIINTMGQVVIPCKYQEIGEQCFGLRKCKRNDKYGYLKMKDGEVIPCQYDYTGKWTNGVTEAKMDKLYGLINTIGQVVTPFEYQEIGEECYGLRKCKRNDKYGYLNSKGEEFIACRYDDASFFFKAYDNNIIAMVMMGTYSMYIDVKGKTINNEDYCRVYDVIEQPPTFPGGEAALLKYIATHVKYPKIAQEQDIQGVVNIRFVVKDDGTIGDVQVAKSLESHCDAEAVRVVKSLPRFFPGKQLGKAVNVWFSLPVRFQIQ